MTNHRSRPFTSNPSQASLLRFLLPMVVFCLLPVTGWGEGEPVWHAFLPGAQEGDPIQIESTSSTPTSTVYEVVIPGIWIATVDYGDDTFSRVEFPPVEFVGSGFPEREGARGWYDFPAETQYPPLDPTRYHNAFSIASPTFRYPSDAMREEPPETAEEMEALGINPAGARPAIPALRGLLAVASETKEEDLALVQTVQTNENIDLTHPLVPAGFEGTDDNTGYTPPALVDIVFYEDFREGYRGVEDPFTPVNQAGLFAVSEFRLPLVERVGPLDIRIPSDFTIKVDYLAGPFDFECPVPWDNWKFKPRFINGEALRDLLTASGQRILASRSARYLILTPSEYHFDLLPLAWWKNSKGLHIDFAFVGDDPDADIARDRDAINAYLEDYFREHYCHGVYVLLVGDRKAIPSGESDHINDFPHYDIFGGDSDHVYQVLGDDTFASMYVGRLPVANAAELQNQVAKIIRHEQSPPLGGWPLQVTLAANSENWNGSKGVSALFPSKYAAAVNAIAEYTDYVLPVDFEVLHAGASSTNAPRATNADVIEAIHRGAGHLLYRGHGIENSWESGWDGSSVNGASFTTSHINQLENSVLPIVYSIACLNSRQRTNNYIAREWLRKIDHGAVAHYGSTTLSYTQENHHRSKAIMRALFEDQFNRLGPALGQTDRLAHSTSGGGSAWHHNTFNYILHGCPELTIRQASVPQTPLEIAPSLVENGILIDATAAAALVTVELSDGRYTNGFTSVEGQLLLEDITLDNIRTIHIHSDGHAYVQEQVQPPVPTRLELRADGLAEGSIALRVAGIERDYLIQVSEDLQSWETLTTIPADSKGGVYTDEPDDDDRIRFYRAIRTPSRSGNTR